VDTLPIFDATIDGEHVEFVALTADSNVDDLLERAFVREVIALRAADMEAYELVWDMVRALLERGRPLEAIEG